VTAGGQPRRLGLEVRFDQQPIHGRLYDDEDDSRLNRVFYGWIGLMAAIDEARAVAPQPPREQQGGR
jgi:hypothetical protein